LDKGSIGNLTGLERISVHVVRATRLNTPERLVVWGKGLFPIGIWHPGSQNTVTAATVVHAARVETAQAARDMQSLESPMTVNDTVAVPALGPLLVPGAVPRGRKSRGLGRPGTFTIRASTTGETQQCVENLVLGRVSGQKLPGFAPRLGAQALGDARRTTRDLVDSPIRMHRCVHQRKALRPERARDGHRTPAQPLDPIVRIRRFEKVRNGVQGRGLTQPSGDSEQVQLVVPEHVVTTSRRNQLSHPAQRAQVVRSPVHHIAHDPEFEGGSKRRLDAAEQRLQLVGTTLHVPDENGLKHGRWIAARPIPRGAQWTLDGIPRRLHCPDRPRAAHPDGPSHHVGGRLARRIILCDGADSARMWARIGAGDDEELTWVPRDKDGRARPPGFHSLPGGLGAEGIGKLSAGPGDEFAVVSEDGPFIRNAVGLIEAASPGIPILVLSDRVDAEELPDHPCLLRAGLRTLIRDDVDQEFSHLANLRRVVELRALIAPREKLGILLQPNPDPDGIACGYALRALLGRKSPTAPLISFGEVKRPENRAMMEVLGLEVRTITPEEFDEFDGLALVDVQPTVFGESPPARVRSVDVVIDHHPERSGYDAVIRDIRPSYGATATILTEYIRACDLDLRPRLATALVYGIKSDTQLLGRETSPGDMSAFAYLHAFHSPALLRRIERPALPGDGLKALGRALASTSVKDGIHLLVLGRVREDVIPQVADMGLQAEGAEWAIAAGIVGPDLVFSVRNVGYVRAAGEVVRAVVEDLGAGGGHRSMAKGIIPVKAFRKVYGSATRETIRDALHTAFVQAIHGDEE